jgi:hypothetical protein
MCGCETWSLILRKEYTLKLFENRVSRRTFGTKGEGETTWENLKQMGINIKMYLNK